MRRPRDASLLGLLGEGDRLLPMLARLFRWTRPDVQQQQGAMRAGKQRSVGEAFGDLEGAMHGGLGFVAPAESLEAHALGDQRPRLHRGFPSRDRGGDRGVVMRQRVVVAAAPEGGHPHVAAHGREPGMEAALFRVLRRPLPQREGVVVLAQPLPRARQLLRDLDNRVALARRGSLE